MNNGENKASALMQYRSILEGAFLKKYLTQEENDAIEQKRKDFGLTSEEATTIQIMVLGGTIGDTTRKDSSPTLPQSVSSISENQTNSSGIKFDNVHTPSTSSQGANNSPAQHQADTNSSDAGVIIFLTVVIIGGVAMLIFFPPSWPVIVGVMVLGAIKSFLAK